MLKKLIMFQVLGRLSMWRSILKPTNLYTTAAHRQICRRSKDFSICHIQLMVSWLGFAKIQLQIPSWKHKADTKKRESWHPFAYFNTKKYKFFGFFFPFEDKLKIPILSLKTKGIQPKILIVLQRLIGVCIRSTILLTASRDITNVSCCRML